MLKTAPAVFAVENTYQILVGTTVPCLFWVRVGDNDYYDESNGILRSLSDVHRACVPMEALNIAGEYTVCVRPLVERKPYFTTTAPVEEFVFSFYPVPADPVRAYHISDAHNRVEEPVAAAKAFGEIDLLILNGDVIDHSGDPSCFDNVYEICARITGGHKPVIFSRGNHDMRGNFAEKFAEYTPNAHGNTYYTFRLGSLWGILLDCGEDKADDSPEYGFTVCCHPFRQRQTAFLKDVIARASQEYAAPGVKTRLVISHHPFTHRMEAPFDIEEDIYREWAKLLKEQVKPDLMIGGHMHTLTVRFPGEEGDHYGQPCPLVIGASPEAEGFAGCGFVFSEHKIQVVFTDSQGQTLSEHRIDV